VIATQAVLIFAMLVQRRRRNLAELAQKKSQAEVQQKRAELAHMSRVASLGELTATLAHELSQPLTAIMTNAGAAQRFLERPEPGVPEVHEALADISLDAERADEIIRRLRAMLKRGMPVESVPVDLSDVIRTVERLVRGERLRHEVTVQLDLAPDLPLTIGDLIQLQQVAMNLMLNAFAAMDRPGRWTRRLMVRTHVSADGSQVQADFEDTGIGIAAEVINRLFDPFVTTKPDGLGMGLSICRSIIERHGGKIRATNNPDGGATFSITLPITRE
jgi:signal transduction histidine kinase